MLKRNVSLLVLCTLLFLLAQCVATAIVPPTITSFTPASAGAGATVTITGTGFTSVTAVKFTGVAATSYHVVSSTSITAVVPKTTTGNITVTAAGGTAWSPSWFTFIPAPTITSFTPSSAAAGATVTITGTNFRNVSAVKFTGVAATSFKVVSATSITAVVPKTTTGVISVVASAGTCVSATWFTFIPGPTITSFTPASAGAGATVTITGTNFKSVSAVKFTGVAATSFKVVSATSITAVVPKTTTGNIGVTTTGGTCLSPTWFTFIPAPTITSFTPSTAGTGTSVTITGTGFTAASTVKFNGVAATSCTFVSATSLKAVVPVTTTGKITVTTAGGTATSASSFTYAGTDLASLVAQGKAKLNQLVMMEPYDATAAKKLVADAYNLFSQARTLSSTNADANFGLALTDAGKTAQTLIDKYQTEFATDSVPTAGLKSATAAFQILNMTNAVKTDNNMLTGFVTNYTKGASEMEPNGVADVALILDVQSDIKNTVMPMLSRVAGYLGTVEAYGGSSYTFPMGTSSWDGYAIVDIGDIYMFHGALLAARWALALPVSYNASPGTYNFSGKELAQDTNHDGLLTIAEYLPPSPFLTLKDSATLAASKADMITACDKIISGVNATLAETSDNHDLFAWHTADSGITGAELQSTKTFVQQVKASMSGPTTITYNGSEGDPMSITAYLGAWAANPPADFKAFMPTMEIYRYRDWHGGYNYEKIVADGGFSDKTFGGLFPGGAPDSFLYEPRKRYVDTGSSGNLSGLTTTPANGQHNVGMDYLNIHVQFSSNPPATFSFVLQRYIAGGWRNVPIAPDDYWGGNEWVFGVYDSLWANTTYRMLITDEVAHVTVTKTFYTGADTP